MLDVNQSVPTGHQSSIARWAYKAIGLPGVRLRTRLRGNDLHILCESTPCPEARDLVPRFVKALSASDGASVFPTDPERPIYQIILYGRALDRQRPDWIEPIPLNQLSQNRSPRQQPTSPNVEKATEPPAAVPKTGSAMLISNESLARQGQPEAIARYLSETLSPMGVAVKVFIQEATDKRRPARGKTTDSGVSQPPSANLARRLWVVCDSDYSPDASLLAQAVTGRLRDLKLEGFHDARILAQVSGEAKPDWVLAVDMTPPEQMLKDWAGWGDVQAIARLLNQTLADNKLQVRAVLKEATLHLFCSRTKGAPEPLGTADKQNVMSAIAPVLESISPQGMHAATVYGLRSPKEAVRSPQSELKDSFLFEEKPVWIEWLNLPASRNPALGETALALAQQGDEPALIFLLQRLVNSDLDWRLATGGIRLSLRRKQDLLHVMTEAPICPLQTQVASPIAKFIRQLGIPKIAGVRVYGRRAGQASHEWSYGVDFTSRSALFVATPPVEFAASPAFRSDQIESGGGLQYIPNPEEPTELTQDIASNLSLAFQALGRTLRQGLCATQLFIPTPQDKDLAPLGPTSLERPKSQGKSLNDSSVEIPTSNFKKVALIWGCAGLLLTVQADWLIGQMLRLQAQSERASALMNEEQWTESPDAVPIPEMSLQKGRPLKSDPRKNKRPVFNSSGFTKEGETSIIVNEQGERVSAGGAAILAAARSPFPSFNNRMLDEKLALYQQRLQQRGGVPPEVLIVGSSRAMRGVDPTVVQNALARAGLGNVEVFNFGVNGATAQVVDLIVRRILTSSQLPKLIIWADGARAFNSGRVDATYNAIASSAGYQQLNAGTFLHLASSPVRPNRSAIAAAPRQSPSASDKGNSSGRTSLTSSYQAVEAQLNRALAKISSTYPQRDRLQTLVLNYFARLIPTSPPYEVKGTGVDVRGGEEDAYLSHLNSDIDFDGFLPLSIRFVPSTYYQQHPRVSGSYDSDYESFQMVGQQDIALEALLQFLQAHQIQLVFVNLPLTKDYLDPVRTRYEQEFRQHMQMVASQKGLIFRDLSNLWPTKNEYFSDPSHLNRFGAYEVSNQLALDPMILWPTH